jgi:hypothetical protein
MAVLPWYERADFQRMWELRGGPTMSLSARLATVLAASSDGGEEYQTWYGARPSEHLTQRNESNPTGRRMTVAA